MHLLLVFLGDLVRVWFNQVAFRIGVNQTLTITFFIAWYALIASLTGVAYTCVSSSGVCGAFAVNWSGLSEWMKFGMSLVPSEVGTIFACLLSLHAAGWSAVVLAKIMKYKLATATGTNIAIR